MISFQYSVKNMKQYQQFLKIIPSDVALQNNVSLIIFIKNISCEEGHKNWI